MKTMTFCFYSLLGTVVFTGYVSYLVLRSVVDPHGRFAEECTLE